MSAAIDCEYTVEGAGPPLILVHGIGAARNAWRFVTPLLHQRSTVISYDLRGHGDSPLSTEPFGLDELVADLERVRERSGFERVHVAGHSLGGMIGPAYARAYSERVLSLGLLSTAAMRTEEDRAKVQGVVSAMEEKGVAQVLGTLVDRWFTRAFIAANQGIVDARLRQVLATDEGIYLNVFRIYAETEMAPWLAEVMAPSLVLTAENDGGCSPRLNRLIAAALPNSELVVLPRYKHAMLLEAPEEVASHLIRFIGEST